MSSIRAPAVAGYFYPEDPVTLRAAVGTYLARAEDRPGRLPKAVVVPHAGYVYSGAVAASVYRLLQSARSRIRRVVLAGPAHRVAVQGAALSPAEAFLTPLGAVAVDPDIDALLGGLPQASVSESAHRLEHSLEVQLPFLQAVLEEFTVVPLLFGRANPTATAEVLARVWGGEDTLVVVSSDLSHYHDYETARRIDAETTAAICALDYDRIGPSQACGCVALGGLLLRAQQHGMRVEALDVRNSGDTAGTRDRVVGYGAYACYET
ncbi:MAG: AmmeMemoRadiSam system protein B [Gammaproteobacteria bacterium]